MKIDSLLLDSGAHSLQHDDVTEIINTYSANKNLKQINQFTFAELAAMRRRKKRDGGYNPFAFYETKEFWDYVDAYCKFLKKYAKHIDEYINVDVIFHPELSWKVLKYMEKEHGLNPIPVIHHGTPLKWLHKHLDAGYEYIGFGGLGRMVAWQKYHLWGDRAWKIICSGPNHKPTVKVHGFAMTSFELMLRYPWWSVDSASWAKVAAYGHIFVAYKRDGQFVYDHKPYGIAVSNDSPKKKRIGKHLLNAGKEWKRLVHEWLEYIGVPYGKTDKKGNVIELGVSNNYNKRNRANLIYYELFRKSIPKWPWPFVPGKIRRPIH
jgi:hypothetical protein